MKTHLLCMGPGYWIVKKGKKTIVEEEKLDVCSEIERDLLLCNMRDRESLLSALLENEYNKVNLVQTSHEIWKALESTFATDDHAK